MIMNITKEMLQTYRHHQLPPNSIKTITDCVAAVERLGFAWAFTPGTNLLPALFGGMAAESAGQQWEWMWSWKDALAASREAYYGRLVAGKPTLIAITWLPTFYALTGNTGDLNDDLAQTLEANQVNHLAPKVAQFIAEYGPTGTRTLVKRLTDGSPEMKGALQKAILQLDQAMLIVKCGAEGGNSIANIWTLFATHFPNAVEQGTSIPTRDAALTLLTQYFLVTPVVTERALPTLFPWNPEHQRKAIARLVEAGDLIPCLFDGRPGLCRPDLLD
jgi:hypothetical protein